jgi:hypothetical protein
MLYAASTLHVKPRVLSLKYLSSAPIGAHAVNRHPVTSLNRDSSRNIICFVYMWAISAKYARRSLKDIFFATRLTFFLEYLTLVKKREIVDRDTRISHSFHINHVILFWFAVRLRIINYRRRSSALLVILRGQPIV